MLGTAAAGVLRVVVARGPRHEGVVRLTGGPFGGHRSAVPAGLALSQAAHPDPRVQHEEDDGVDVVEQGVAPAVTEPLSTQAGRGTNNALISASLSAAGRGSAYGGEVGIQK